MNPLQAMRKHHAIEHASLSVLVSKNPSLRLSGYSDPLGFWVVGDVDTDILLAAVDEAIARLQAGEKSLAVHPNCGTNFAAAGLVAGTLAWLGMLGGKRSFKRQLDRWPLIVSLATAGMIAAQPLGPYLQANLTTDASIGDLKVKEVTITRQGSVKVHRFKLG
ncbi:MAG: hypothetical protein GYA15_03125 [Leptolinea sp.]|jgi:hypothetical protein|nr:hypothetical protein [Leptolinea sp.]